MRVQHLWQSVDPTTAGDAVTETDRMVYQAAKEALGGKEMTRLVAQQASMPQRFAGLGYKRSATIATAAYLGGFTMTSYGRYGAGHINPDLKRVLESPDLKKERDSPIQLESMGDAHGSAHSGVTHAFKHVAETRSRLANVVGKGRLSLRDFHPEV